jgi:hypothetical protein
MVTMAGWDVNGALNSATPNSIFPAYLDTVD